MIIEQKTRMKFLRFSADLQQVAKVERKSDNRFCSFVAFCRNEATRTPDPYVPNVVRYQLRYIPFLFCECKGKAFFEIKRISQKICRKFVESKNMSTFATTNEKLRFLLNVLRSKFLCA